MPVVTISSQFGAGARDLGLRVAELLSLQYVDQAVLVDAARQLGVTVSSVAAHDERIDSLRERLSHFLQRALEGSAAGGSVDPFVGAGSLEVLLAQSYKDVIEGSTPLFLDDRTYLETITQIIGDVAIRGDMVILGRGSQMILRDRPDMIHVQCVAEEDIRIARVQEWEGLSKKEARIRIRDFNRSRAAFHKKFWKVDVWDPRLYDLVINTTHLDYAASAEIVARAVEAKTGIARKSDASSC